MKYIKLYESFVNFTTDFSNEMDSLKIEIEDILRELEDDNIRVDVNAWDGVEVFLTNKSEHKLRNFTTPDTFPYEVIKPHIEHLISFLGDKGYTLKTTHNIVDLRPRVFRNVSELDGRQIGRLELRFTN